MTTSDAMLGRGFNSISGLGLNYAIADRTWGSDPLLAVNTTILQVASEEAMAERLSLGASAAFRGYGGSASAKAQFSREATISASSLYAMVSCTVRLERRVLKTPRLTPEAEEMLVDQDFARFLRAFGDVFASEVFRGGELHSIVQIETRSAEHRQYASLEIEAAGGVVSANGQIEQSANHFQKLRTTKISVCRGGATTDLPDYASLVDYVKRFQADVTDAGGAVLEPPTFSDYGGALLPKGVREAPNLRVKSDVLRRLAALARTIRAHRSAIAYIVAAPSLFVDVSLEDLRARDAQLVTMAEAVDQQGNELIRDPVSFSPLLPEINPDSVLPLPEHERHHALPLEVLVRRAQGVGTGREAEWVGRGLNGLTQQLVVRFALPEPDLTIECEVCYLHRQDPVLPCGQLARLDLDADRAAVFEHGIKGLRIWLEGPRKNNYDVHYGVEMTPDGHVEEAANGRTVGQWDTDLKQYHHQVCSLKVVIQSRL